MTDVSPDDIMAVRKATGAPIHEVRKHLEQSSTELRGRIVEASNHRLQSEDNDHSGSALEDPIIRDASSGPQIARILAEEQDRIRAENEGGWPLGSCHLIWKRTKERAMHEHGLRWYSPAELNPFAAYD